jgi:hypothetical protein
MGNSEPGEQHTRSLLIEGVVGKMVSKQLFFDPEFEREDNHLYFEVQQKKWSGGAYCHEFFNAKK